MVIKYFCAFSALTLLVGWQEGHPACKKTEWWGAGVAICLERGADLHTAQLMPLPLIVSCFSKIQIGFTFLVPAHPGSPGQRAIKRVCVWLLSTSSHLAYVATLPSETLMSQNKQLTRGNVLSWEYRSLRKQNSRPPASVILCWVSWECITYLLICWFVYIANWFVYIGKNRQFMAFLDSKIHNRLAIVTANELGFAFPAGNLPKKFCPDLSMFYLVIVVTDKRTPVIP